MNNHSTLAVTTDRARTRTLMNNKKLKRASMVFAALAASTVGLISTGGVTAFAGPPVGTAVMSPTTGNSDTVFSLLPSDYPANAGGGAYCSGSGAASYRWQTYIVDAGVDPSTLTYGTGPLPVAGHYVSRLYDAGGNSVSNKNPSPSGQITGIPTFSLAVNALTPGDYKLGFACSKGGVVDDGRYWQTTITVVADAGAPGGSGHFTFAPPAAPVVPEFPAVALATLMGGAVLGGTVLLRGRKATRSLAA